MTTQLIKWVIPGLLFVAEMGAVAAQDLQDSILPQLGMESTAVKNLSKDDVSATKEQQDISELIPTQTDEITDPSGKDNDQSESDDETEEEEDTKTTKTRFGVGYEYRRNQRAGRVDRPERLERPERPQRVERPQRPDRPGRFGQ